MSLPPSTARVIGLALVVSAAVLGFLAVFFWIDPLGLRLERPALVSGVLAIAGAVDLVIGIRYLSQASAR
ncbi:MAG: hypothetical protein KJ061_03225 [Vicinamibacteraceae bacterium]|nr:hypothetical protein [Vicinamibacteraceae bacterium]